MAWLIRKMAFVTAQNTNENFIIVEQTFCEVTILLLTVLIYNNHKPLGFVLYSLWFFLSLSVSLCGDTT